MVDYVRLYVVSFGLLFFHLANRPKTSLILGIKGISLLLSLLQLLPQKQCVVKET